MRVRVERSLIFERKNNVVTPFHMFLLTFAGSLVDSMLQTINLSIKFT